MKNAILIVSLIVAGFSLFFYSLVLGKSAMIKTHYEDSIKKQVAYRVKVRELDAKLVNQNKAVVVLLNQLQRVRTLNDLDTILLRFKIKRSVPVKE